MPCSVSHNGNLMLDSQGHINDPNHRGANTVNTFLNTAQRWQGLTTLHPKLKKTQHIIEVNCADNIEIYCHAGAISQIFTNLIINSILHGFDGIEHGIITINVKLKEHCLHLYYQDNGIGVPQEQLPHLFEPFYTTKAGAGGTGLGTHIVNELVTDTLNGKITAHCDVGQGLSYHIEFNDMR